MSGIERDQPGARALHFVAPNCPTRSTNPASCRRSRAPRIWTLVPPTCARSRPEACQAAIPAVLTQADYDAAVLANLHALGSMSSSQLQASVGGSLNEVRAALQRLITNQQASRVGQAKNTRYVPTEPKPAGT